MRTREVVTKRMISNLRGQQTSWYEWSIRRHFWLIRCPMRMIGLPEDVIEAFITLECRLGLVVGDWLIMIGVVGTLFLCGLAVLVFGGVLALKELLMSLMSAK